MKKKEKKYPVKYPVVNKPGVCPWCNKNIKPEQSVLLSTKTHWDCLPKEEWVEVKLADGQKAVGFILKPGSKQAKRADCDILFVACSKCRNQALAVLEQENFLVKRVGFLIKDKKTGNVKTGWCGGLKSPWENLG